MTQEEEIKKMREENKSLRDALSNVMPDSERLKSAIGNMEAMAKEVKQLEQVKKSMEGFATQLAPLQKFLASDEAKKAMEKFSKNK